MKNVILIILVLCFGFINCFSQSSIGTGVGYGACKLFDLNKSQEYVSKYQFHNSLNVMFFYEMKLDSNTNFRFETSYLYKELDLEVKYNAGKGSFYRDLSFRSHFFNATFLYSFNLTPQRQSRINFLLGPVLSFNLKTTTKGNGWDYVLINQIDTNGNNVSILTTQNWEIDDKNSKEINWLNIGVDAGFEFPFAITNNIDVYIQNRYFINVTDILTSKKLSYTSLFRPSLNIGLKYRI
jgi:hypothetical protein